MFLLPCGCQFSVSIPCGVVAFPGHTHFLYFSECNNVKNEVIFGSFISPMLNIDSLEYACPLKSKYSKMHVHLQ